MHQVEVSQDVLMRIIGSEQQPLDGVYLALSDEEARELIGMLEELQTAGRGWHGHLSDQNYDKEITVYREDDPTAVF